MPTSGVKVLVFGKVVKLPYQVLLVSDTKSLFVKIANFHPDVIVTFDTIPSALNNASFELRKRWINVPSTASEEEVVREIEACYFFNLWKENPNAVHNPLVSVFTGTRNTGDFLRDTYQSLREQVWTNWEWIVCDDSSSDGTWDRLVQIGLEDIRVRPYRIGVHSGKVGEVKDVASRLARGQYLVELDHDDMLTDNALTEIVKAFQSDPEAGMVYSNSASFFEDGSPQRFNDEFWKERYRTTRYRGKEYLECRNPNIYDRFGPHFSQQFGYFLTVGPNHVRAFRADTFRKLGGYNPNLPVADDWDLYARFFLRSKCVHIDKMLYLYRYLDGWGNTTFTRNQSIQDHLALGRMNYQQEFASFNEKRLSIKEESQVYSVDSISFVVPAGAAGVHTQECLKSIRQWAPNSEIILIANGCSVPKESRELASKVIDLEVNLKFAAACNRGVMEATKPLVCIVNDDCQFVDRTPDLLVKAISERKASIVAPYSNRAKPPQGDIERELCPKGDLFIGAVVGVCMMLPAELYRKLGGFDPRLYTYEDDDICVRAARLGEKCCVVGGAWIQHERHTTFKARGEDVYAVMNENRMLFQRKYPKIKVIALAKNEESAIEGFLHQFSGIASELCVLDTGSTDRTVELAIKAGARVEPGIFENFAQARNEAIDRFGQPGDWILMLDPDERLDRNTIENLHELLSNTASDIFLAPLHAVGQDGSRKEFVPKVFLFKFDPAIRWIFKVHEKVVGSDRQALLVNARIEHMMALHTLERRSWSSRLYDRLMEDEPYFTDLAYQKKIRKEWPILDYDKMSDPRLAKIHIGPLVSVIIPTYNRPHLLKKAVQSALNQDYANLEVVVVGDNCPEMETSLMAFPFRVRRLNLPKNHGAGGAIPRNYAINLAAGELIAYLDDDNSWEPNHISSLYSELKLHGTSFAFSSMEASGKDLIFESPAKGSIDTSCVLHRKDLVRKYGWWKDRIEGTYWHDWELFSRWVSAGESWSATKLCTLIYNVETCGQREFLEKAAAGVQ